MLHTTPATTRLALGPVALGLLSLVAWVACDGADSEPAGEGGASSASTTTAGPTTTTSTGDSGAGGAGGAGGDGGAPDASSSVSSSSGHTTTSSGGEQEPCDEAANGRLCDVEGMTCEENVGGDCEGGVPRVTSCVNGRWQVWTALSCEAFVPDPQCDLPGRYLVEPSGPFEPDEDGFVEQWGGPFEVAFEVRDDGRLYVSSMYASIDTATCEVALYWILDDSCDGFGCETTERYLDLTMAEQPAVGDVRIECYGECDVVVTAPVTGTRL